MWRRTEVEQVAFVKRKVLTSDQVLGHHDRSLPLTLASCGIGAVTSACLHWSQHAFSGGQLFCKRMTTTLSTANQKSTVMLMD